MSGCRGSRTAPLLDGLSVRADGGLPVTMDDVLDDFRKLSEYWTVPRLVKQGVGTLYFPTRKRGSPCGCVMAHNAAALDLRLPGHWQYYHGRMVAWIRRYCTLSGVSETDAMAVLQRHSGRESPYSAATWRTDPHEAMPRIVRDLRKLALERRQAHVRT